MYRALLVDDESLALEGLNLLVDWQGAGFVVCGQAENGQEALALMEQLRPHLVVTDLYMPLYQRSEVLLVSARILNCTVTAAHEITSDVYRFMLTDTLSKQW